MTFTGFTIENLTEVTKDVFLGEAIGTMMTSLFILGLFLIIGFYVYHAFAWQKIAKKQKYKYPWLAWIPFANISQILELGSFHWALIFLFLIPILGWIALFVLMIIAIWRVFEKENYPGWFSLSLTIPKVGGILYLIAIGFVAWKKSKK